MNRLKPFEEQISHCQVSRFGLFCVFCFFAGPEIIDSNPTQIYYNYRRRKIKSDKYFSSELGKIFIECQKFRTFHSREYTYNNLLSDRVLMLHSLQLIPMNDIILRTTQVFFHSVLIFLKLFLVFRHIRKKYQIWNSFFSR